MIYTVTLNPAVDRELTVPQVQFDSVLRATDSHVDYGGKGFNVSRMLRQLGTSSIAPGFVGGRAGELLKDGLDALGIPTDLMWVAGETRTNVSIVTEAHDRYIKVNEPGPLIDAAKQQELIEKVRSLVRAADWWVLSGSLPPGVPPDYYARLVQLIQADGARAIVDTSGEALRLACAEKAYMVKPNAEEAQVLSGLRVNTPGEAASAAQAIRGRGAGIAVISMGRDGAVFSGPEGAFVARAPSIEEKNPIGAGDALVGGLVWGMARGLPMKDALRWGVASGAAAASLPGTEVGSMALIERLYSQVGHEDL